MEEDLVFPEESDAERLKGTRAADLEGGNIIRRNIARQRLEAENNLYCSCDIKQHNFISLEVDFNFTETVT